MPSVRIKTLSDLSPDWDRCCEQVLVDAIKKAISKTLFQVSQMTAWACPQLGSTKLNQAK